MRQDAQIEFGSKATWKDEDAWSIVLIGITGAGKSYFANTLLGSKGLTDPTQIFNLILKVLMLLK